MNPDSELELVFAGELEGTGDVEICIYAAGQGYMVFLETTNKKQSLLLYRGFATREMADAFVAGYSIGFNSEIKFS